MRVLAVDIGTGTQDILLFDTALQPENCFKLVLPSPTMMVAQRVKQATRHGEPLLLTGIVMGGGPSHWAVRDHARAGHPVFATPTAAMTFDDDLDKVRAMGVQIIDSDDAQRLSRRDSNIVHLHLKDLDYQLITSTLEHFGIQSDFDGLAVAVFDHGAAPPSVSDRQFRFDFLDERIRASNQLAAFAFAQGEIPTAMTRLRAVAMSAFESGLPDRMRVMVMDTAPAAALGATLDAEAARHSSLIVVNVGNFHTLAFRLRDLDIDGVFEHHTGFMTTEKLDGLLNALEASTLKHEDVFLDEGHGALIYNPEPSLANLVLVTGPRRGLMRGSTHPTRFAVPYGDMMIAGCWGLIKAWPDVFPDDSAVIQQALRTIKNSAPWELL